MWYILVQGAEGRREGGSNKKRNHLRLEIFIWFCPNQVKQLEEYKYFYAFFVVKTNKHAKIYSRNKYENSAQLREVMQ